MQNGGQGRKHYQTLVFEKRVLDGFWGGFSNLYGPKHVQGLYPKFCEPSNINQNAIVLRPTFTTTLKVMYLKIYLLSQDF